jgi:hypothetical protein
MFSQQSEYEIIKTINWAGHSYYSFVLNRELSPSDRQVKSDFRLWSRFVPVAGLGSTGEHRKGLPHPVAN